MKKARPVSPTLLLGSLALTAWSCSGSSQVPTMPQIAAPAEPPTVAAATARYRVTFDATWSGDTHSDLPPGPHFSGLIGGTHRDTVQFWTPGAAASEGIRQMAERGRKSPLDEEVQAAIQAGHAQHLLSGGAVDRTPGRVDLELDISRDYPLVTLVTMVAPSPDWFVGVSGQSLIVNGDWTRELTVPLFAYDAGTDSGVSFLSPDQATLPRENVFRVMDAPFRVGAGVPPLGTFTFRRIQ
jgi:hypothetical protein